MKLDDFTLIDIDFRSKDPRQLAYMYPKGIINSEQKLIAYNKKISQFVYYHGLDIAESMAKRMGYILLPTSIIHWRRARQLGEDRRVRIGRNIFYLVKESELNSKEVARLVEYAEEVRKEVANF